MKKNYVSDIRYCEKIKQSQSFKSVDGLQKKVRKRFIHNSNNQYDAQKLLREIICFWKEGWDYEHFHPVFLNPKVYYPIVTMADPEEQTNPELKKYAQMIQMIIQRLRIDQEIEVNYKIEERKYISNWESIDLLDDKWKYFKVASLANSNLLNCLSAVTKAMVNSVQQSIDQVSNMCDVLDQEHFNNIQLISHNLFFLNRIIDHTYQTNENQMQEESKEVSQTEMDNLNKFVANATMILDQMKNQNHGPSLISVQPKIGELTYVLHPIMWSIYALFYKEKVTIKQVNKIEREFDESIEYNSKQTPTPKQMDEAENQKRRKIAQVWSNLPEREENYLLDIKDNFKRENEAHSRVVFLNLDGYESEYNLEVARNFYQNLMYISFPKFQTDSENNSSAYEQRFYNKIMFEETRLSEDVSDNEELKQIYKQEKIIKSPELYHEHIEQLYKQHNKDAEKVESEEYIQEKSKKFGSITENEEYMKIIDRNQRIFIFPIKMNCLIDKNRENVPETVHSISSFGKESTQKITTERMDNQLPSEAENLCDIAENYESYLIRFLMRKYLFGKIQRFRPSHIIISYSNRTVIEDTHFVEMLQELTNLSKCKLMFFPNFTSSFVDEIKLETTENSNEEEVTNCYAVPNARLQMSTSNSYMEALKMKGYDDCPLTLSFFNKLIRFLKISSGTYNLQQYFEYEPFALKLKNVKIYHYIEFLFNVLSSEYSHLSNKIDKEMLKADKYFLEERIRQEKQELKRCIPKLYKELFKVLEKLVIDGIYEEQSIEVNLSEKQSSSWGPPISPYTIDVRRIFEKFANVSNGAEMTRTRLYRIRQIREPFDEFINSEEKEKMDSKYETNYHIYFKTRSQTEDYGNTNEQSINAKSTNAGLRLVTFMLENKEPLPIYKDTSVLFETNQIGKSFAFVLVMNHLGIHDDTVKYYIGKVPLEKKPSFSHQNCILKPIRFFDGTDLMQTEKFKAKCEWNYKETDSYLILYWPSEYDFIKASLFKMMKQHYESRICQDIFIAKKTAPTDFFKARINLDASITEVLPRRGCSAYNYKNRVFIFGGVYEREYNYMNVQNDIMTIDLEELNPKKESISEKDCEMKMGEMSLQEKPTENVRLQTCSLTLKNLKGQLYSKDFVDRVVSDGSSIRKLNSFVRPKIDVQFYDAEDICTREVQTLLSRQECDTVIMVGGYGQNFMFPHSLLTYFYHILKFDKITRELKSIQKRNVYERPIPINLKELVKNKNIFQQFKIYENDMMSEGLTKESHYIFHRVVYQLSKLKNESSSNGSEVFDMNYKFVFLYATQLFNEMDKNYLKFAQKIGERRVIEESDGVKVEVVNGCNNNLFITNDDTSCVYSLNYKPQLFSSEAIPLINEAIISLDVTNNIICALIKHKDHTKDKCVLANQKVEMPDPKFAFQNKKHFVNLVKFIQFQENYELHALFMMKRTELIILHGVSFEEYDVKDKVISTKYINAEGLGQIKEEQSPQISTPSVSLKQFYDCTSFLGREKQKVFSVNFLSSQSKQEDFVYGFCKYSLDMNSNPKVWKQQQNQMRYISFYLMSGETEVYLRKVEFVEVRQSSRSKLSSSNCIIVPSNPVSLSKKQFSFCTEKIESEPLFNYNDKPIHKVRVYEVPENEVWSRISWKRIYKNHQRYVDCGLMLRETFMQQT